MASKSDNDARHKNLTPPTTLTEVIPDGGVRDLWQYGYHLPHHGLHLRGGARWKGGRGYGRDWGELGLRDDWTLGKDGLGRGRGWRLWGSGERERNGIAIIFAIQITLRRLALCSMQLPTLPASHFATSSRVTSDPCIPISVARVCCTLRANSCGISCASHSKDGSSLPEEREEQRYRATMLSRQTY